MKNYLFFWLRLIAFWFLYFFLQRILFLGYESFTLGNFSWKLIFGANLYALWYDVSSISYLLIIPVFLFLFSYVIGWKRAQKIISIYNIILICLIALANVADLGLYQEWGNRITWKAMYCLRFPRESLGTLTSEPLLTFFIIFTLQVAAFIFLYKKICPSIDVVPEKSLRMNITTLALCACIFIGARGGLDKYPLSKNKGYFSHNDIANVSTINSLWNVSEVIEKSGKSTINDYVFYPKVDKDRILRDMYSHIGDSSTSILKVKKPNIVIIMLESWSADVIGVLGGEKDVTPGFNSLCDDGLLFTNFYSNGFRTEQGLTSILNSFPAQPKTSVLNSLKFSKLTGLVSVLKENGYSTGAYYATDLDFDNVRPYFKSCGFNRMLDDEDIPSKGHTIWGAYDEDLFKFQLKDQANVSQPFFSLMMTISSHEPFEIPCTSHFKGEHIAIKYRNAVRYTDSCLVEYFKEAKKQPWYDNTLFIVVADHAHQYPYSRAITDPGRYHIPMVMLGGALKDEYRGKKNISYGNHIDINATVLHQIGLSSEKFHWSKDLLSNKPGFAFFTFDNGLGFISDKHYLVYDHYSGGVINKDDKINDILQQKYLSSSKAILQQINEEFISW